ncbi:MAG: ParB N-terminal domain-containing protein [Deltaproteobacteria bacterium]|nr:ParB N-terminal domain-containing protein [Deltaproteobacteria bacterium]
MDDIWHILRDGPILLNIDDIKEKPGPYTISFGFDLRPLVRSIREFGLINAPIVTRGEDGCMDIVAGYRRIMALRSLRWKKVPCIDLSDSGLEPLELLLFNLHDNISTRRFNDVEKGMVLNRLIPFIPGKEIREHYMPLLDISNTMNLDILIRLEELDTQIKESIADGTLSLNATRLILDMDNRSRTAIFKWISNVKLNFNHQIQFIEYSTDISIKEEKSISELLDEEQISRLLEDKRTNNPQKAKHVLDLLRSRRSPFLTRSEKTFKKNISGLNLPQGVRIQHPPFFESPEYRLEILFRDGKELKEKIDSLAQIDRLKKVGDPWQEDS